MRFSGGCHRLLQPLPQVLHALVARRPHRTADAGCKGRQGAAAQREQRAEWAPDIRHRVELLRALDRYPRSIQALATHPPESGSTL